MLDHTISTSQSNNFNFHSGVKLPALQSKRVKSEFVKIEPKLRKQVTTVEHHTKRMNHLFTFEGDDLKAQLMNLITSYDGVRKKTACV